MQHRILFIVLLVSSHFYGQNLIDNGGFENYTSLPTNVMQSDLCIGWSKCNLGGGGSPDYFHTGGTGLVALPNSFYATINPHGGNAIMGLITYHGLSTYFREYISHSFISPLVVGQTYTVTYYVSNGIYNGNYGGCGSSNLAMAFTMTEPVQNGSGALSGIIPQHEHSSILYSTDWQQVTFSFVADSAYNHLVIGNFKENTNTLIQNFENASIETAYYFIDDISIIAETGHSGINPLTSSIYDLKVNQMDKRIDIKTNESQKYQLTIFNTMGNIVFISTLQGEQSISFSNFSSGIYFYQLSDSREYLQNGKIVIN